ncbi:Carboxypeptidase B-like protein [Emericellopsis cladophorae]|uniref:Carboxypeptidase B-like protein n=1 Tax=Emericellopsis cladophorae TaxID=2686198 RepID=A0A9P9Y162_9HYPO|nr:Carboxypeptidase B-like protein [Emericellopsis cladophorae]KAI6781644.1 Carboxypeptidase B-like protein [Emericellopsis cladophorae]
MSDYPFSTDVGIDLNKNFHFVWDHRTEFNPGEDVFSVASDGPSFEIYHGSAAAASEPQIKAVYWVLNTYNSSLSFLVQSVIVDAFV